jgi:hypothetical protein
MLHKDSKFAWGEGEHRAFENIKKLWKEKLELTIPDLNDTFILETDASQTGLGACLSQNESPIGFISRTLSKEGKNYSITEREVLDALWAMKNFSISY